jgi:hypothetical protein
VCDIFCATVHEQCVYDQNGRCNLCNCLSNVTMILLSMYGSDGEVTPALARDLQEEHDRGLDCCCSAVFCCNG